MEVGITRAVEDHSASIPRENEQAWKEHVYRSIRAGKGSLVHSLNKEEEKGTGYFSGDVRGRPRWRSVDCRPKVVATTACQSAVPKGCWRFTQVRSVVSS